MISDIRAWLFSKLASGIKLDSTGFKRRTFLVEIHFMKFCSCFLCVPKIPAAKNA